MIRRFSKEFLFEIRNHIPIDALISQALKIPNKISEGYFRFLCPVCREFNTATDPKTNLARCFLCERRFNTIEIVKECNRLDFVQAVLYLDQYRKSLHDGSRKVEPPPLETKKAGFVTLGEILQVIRPDRINPVSSSTPEKPQSIATLKLADRITQIERQLSFLTGRIQALETKMR